jgi:hypothetical protein
MIVLLTTVIMKVTVDYFIRVISWRPRRPWSYIEHIVSCPLVRSSIHCVPLHHPTPITHFIFINVVFCNSPHCTPCFAFQAKTLCNILYVYRTSSQNRAINYAYPNMLRSRLHEHICKQLRYIRRETKAKREILERIKSAEWSGEIFNIVWRSYDKLTVERR